MSFRDPVATRVLARGWTRQADGEQMNGDS